MSDVLPYVYMTVLVLVGSTATCAPFLAGYIYCAFIQQECESEPKSTISERDIQDRVSLESLVNPLVYGVLASIVFGYIAYAFGLTPYGLALPIIFYALLLLLIIDARTMLLPDILTQPLLWAGVMFGLLGWGPVSLSESIMGVMAGYLPLAALGWIGILMGRPNALGRGDAKLCAALGAWGGVFLLPQILLMAVVIFIGYAIGRYGHKAWGRPTPFGPALCIGGMISLLAGNLMF